MKITILEVGFAEVSQIDKRDATQIETHQECISCHLFVGSEFLDRMQTLDLADGLCRYGSLTGLRDTGIDIIKGMLLWSKSLCHSFVVGSTENAEIEGTGVAAYLRCMMQVCLIGAHLFCIYLSQRDILVVPVSLKAVEGCSVMQRGAVLPVFQQQGNKEVHELK